MTQRQIIHDTFEKGQGIFRMAPIFIPRLFNQAGRRLRLHPNDYYALGTRRGAIKERWFSSVIPAMNGPLAPADEVRRLVEEAPQHVLVVIDEAYIEFLEDPVDLLPLIRSGHHSNLMLLRTFSKIHGLAGLRVGYGFGHPEIISALEKVREPFNVNSLAQVAATAALDDAAHIQRTRENNRAGQQFLAAGFRRLKLEFIPSQTNFVMARVGPGQRVFESLQRQGVIARPLGGYGLPEWLRISVGIPDENARCLTALQQALAEQED